MPPLDGPRLDPLSGSPSGLVVLLHGYGSNGDDLISLAGQARMLLPQVAWVAPDAPLAGPFGGRMWFPLERLDAREVGEGVETARVGLDAFLDAEQGRTGLPGEKVVIAGFSQGTIVGLHVGLRRAALGGIVGFSGLLASPERLGEISIRPPVALVHGDEDPVIPAQASRVAAEELRAAGVPVSLHVSRGVGHTVDPAGLMFGVEAIRAALG